MSFRLEYEPDWQQHLAEPVRGLLGRVGDEIEADAKANAPVRTGRLKASIYSDVIGEGMETQVAVGSDLHYAIDVEEGHHEDAWGHETGRWVEPEPFLRPALYRARGE